MPALLIETGFLNSDKDNQLYDEKNAEIAQAIAGAILGTLDQQQGEEPLYYRVQTGVFRKRENADRMLYMLQEKVIRHIFCRMENFIRSRQVHFHSWIMLSVWNRNCGRMGTVR